MSPISAKRQRFIDEYLVDLNATQAAIRSGYSKKTAGVQGTQLLGILRDEIEEAKVERRKRTEFDQDKVLKELAKVGFFDIRELASWGSGWFRWIDSESLTDEAAACVQEVNFTVERRYDRNGDLIETTNMKIKAHDKKPALKMLGDHLGSFTAGDSDVGKMADSFMAGVHTVKSMAVEDKSE